MHSPEIEPYAPTFRDQVIDLAIRTWAPVFAKTKDEVPRFVYDNFYPQGWRARQRSDVAALLDTARGNLWLARHQGELVGFVGIRLYPEDRMGEIHILAVEPAHQRKGVGRRLIGFAETEIRARGMKMVMVETVGDTGHAPARQVYEACGYKPWPVARYFRKLSADS